ncbi:MalY/PatB family protein [Deinococcus peraridilitoris]|uniref:cysteine-S-conjugate beta-lyase n=1 Tax=Deinococcus peraridilitoris (strain DSM 19664 / LMG 22246 / CIP 109416 / KR-200) TaxID=937777 RepID=L0A499_DEIPD|nr:PatB family C-S lyase [Deinococcus peraridilitoris]AFZ68708.1 bifunctional PLP-dependent enzyme with beta-cystathionase and maltose regulon repressor activities [Deinococcus peraridilitoris DSM 19664]
MPHLFDDVRPEDLRHADSYKWTTHPAEVLPLWVADMDFPVAEEITDALHRRLTRSVGYPQLQGDPALLDLLAARQTARGHPDLPREGMWLLPGVVPGLYASVLGLTGPGEEVLTHTPIYPPFLSAIEDHGRRTRPVPLLQQESGWEIDWGALEDSVTPATRLLLFCSPHNPTGRVWTREELERLGEFALRHRLWVVSDELHADLVLDGEFVSLASLGADIAQRTVTLTGPCKTFNTAGLPIGAAMSANPALIARLQLATRGVMAHPGALSIEMWRAGLTHGERWLGEVLDYLKGNREFLAQELRHNLPEVRFTPPQATYLAWLDFRAFRWSDEAYEFLLREARVGLNNGPTFGPGYQGFLRLNFATSRAVLQEALARIVHAAS